MIPHAADSKIGMLCPACGNGLEGLPQIYSCKVCAKDWPSIEGHPYFDAGRPGPRVSEKNEDLDSLVRDVKNVGWRKAVFEYSKSLARTGIPLDEDRRSADLRYLLPLGPQDAALVLGAGWGEIPAVVSDVCREVYVVEACRAKMELLAARKREQGIRNLHPIYLHPAFDLPFPNGQFDVVFLRNYAWSLAGQDSFRKAIRRIRALLKKNGRVFLSLGNRWAYNRLLRKGDRHDEMSPCGIHGYQTALKKEGFSDVRVYIPLPRREGIPLFYIPYENPRILDHFLRYHFSLFEMVSPEVKRTYGLEYTLAKWGVRAIVRFRLAGLAKIMAPGFVIVANRNDGHSHAA